MKLEDICLFVSGSAQNTYYRQVCSKQHVTCLKKLVMVSVAGLKPVRLHDSSPLVVLSRERLPMMLEFLRSDHEPFLSARRQKKTNIILKCSILFIDKLFPLGDATAGLRLIPHYRPIYQFINISLICQATKKHPPQSASKIPCEVKG